eukprot:scaffold208580_cov16-Tisochrysis_lutea.AAC.1
MFQVTPPLEKNKAHRQKCKLQALVLKRYALPQWSLRCPGMSNLPLFKEETQNATKHNSRQITSDTT